MSDAIATVVFDLDGVLVDSESVWDAVRREVAQRRAHSRFWHKADVPLSPGNVRFWG